MKEVTKADLEWIKLPPLSKEEDGTLSQDLLKCLSENYQIFKDIYWYQAGIGIVDNVYQIPLNCFTDFLSA